MADATRPPARVRERTLRSDALLTFAAKGSTALLNFGAAVLVARALGPSGQGIVAVGLTLALVLISLGSLGIVTSNPVYVARDPALRPRLVANTLWWGAGFGVALAGAEVALKGLAPGALPDLSWSQVAIVAALTPAALTAVLLQTILLGAGRTWAYNGVELGSVLVALAALVPALFVFDVGTTTALAILLVQYPLAAVAYLVLLSGRPFAPAWPDLALLRELIGFGLRVYLAVVLAFLLIRFDLFLVNAYLGSEQAGYYSVAVVVAQGMLLVPTAVGTNLIPRVARGSTHARAAEIFRSMAFLYGGLCLLATLLGGPAIELLLGDDFSDSVPLFYWLLPGIFSLGMVTILSFHLSAYGYPLEGIAIWALCVALNVILNVVLLADEGAYIASLASSVCYTLALVLHIRLFARIAGGYRMLVPRSGDLGRSLRLLTSRS